MMLINQRKFKDADDYLVDAEKAIKEYINWGWLSVVYKLNDLFDSTDIYSEVGFRSNFSKIASLIGVASHNLTPLLR